MADSNIVELGCVTKLDLPPDRILTKAIDKLDGVVIVGWDKDDKFYFASSYASGPEALWLLEKAKTELLAVTVDG